VLAAGPVLGGIACLITNPPLLVIDPIPILSPLLKLAEPQSTRRQRIQIRRLDFSPKTPQIREPQIIRQDHENIAPLTRTHSPEQGKENQTQNMKTFYQNEHASEYPPFPSHVKARAYPHQRVNLGPPKSVA